MPDRLECIENWIAPGLRQFLAPKRAEGRRTLQAWIFSFRDFGALRDYGEVTASFFDGRRGYDGVRVLACRRETILGARRSGQAT